jgi:predicted nucleic acid-binding protein
MSAVVMMELAAGARSARDRRSLRTLFSAFRRAGRILLPTAAIFEEAGEVLRRLRERGHNMRGVHSLSNDVLIALSARSIGAVVITQNRTDFEAIRAIRPFLLVVI